MTTPKARRVLAPDAEIIRVFNVAQSLGLPVAGLDVGRDYVRTIPPSQEGDSVGQYVRSTHSPAKAQSR